MMVQHCHACGGLIAGEPAVPFENRLYHAGCFVCQACRRPIGDGYYGTRNHQPYHLECLHPPPGPRCAGCGDVIFGSAIVRLDKYWHPEHFVCTGCGAPLTTSRICEHQGAPYCEACYRDLSATECAICRRPIHGGFVQSRWGDTYCEAHEGEFERCSCCGRLICPALTKDGYRYEYGDGRGVCTLCRETSIDEYKPAWHAYNEVRRSLRRRGLDLLSAPIPLELADRRQIAAVASTQSAGDTFGATMKYIDRQRRGSVGRIYILYGLPEELFTATAAHELGHAWLCLNNVLVDQPETEEGFCELLAYLWLESLGTPSSRGWMQGLLENRNPVFSNGLQQALESYRRTSLPRLLAQLRLNARMP